MSMGIEEFFKFIVMFFGAAFVILFSMCIIILLIAPWLDKLGNPFELEWIRKYENFVERIGKKKMEKKNDK